MLRKTDKPGLGGGGAVAKGHNAPGPDPLGLQQGPNPVAGVIQPDPANTHHFQPKLAHVGGHAPGTADSLLVMLLAQHQDGRFRTDTLGVAIYVAIEYEVAHQQYALAAERLNQFDQAGDQSARLAASPGLPPP